MRCQRAAAADAARPVRVSDVLTSLRVRLSGVLGRPQELLAALRVIYPTLPDPLEFYATRWYEDPWSRGAYSYYAVDNPKNITQTIGEAAGRVLFAGEAASGKPGTVLGAYLSGLDRADQLFEKLG